MLINNKWSYTDSVDDEDLCDDPEIRTLLDMLAWDVFSLTLASSKEPP